MHRWLAPLLTWPTTERVLAARLTHVVKRARLAVLLAVLLGVGCAGPPAMITAAPLLVTGPRAEPPPPAPLALPPLGVSGRRPEPEPPPAPERKAAEPPPEGTAVLHVGDSFVHAGLTQRLRERFAPLGVRYEVRAKASTITLDWAKRLPLEIGQTQPDLVIITLGANELRSTHLDVQARAIRRIVKAIGSRPCVWTTPPLWIGETGFFDTLQQNLSPCRFFETDREVGAFLPRRDGIHPTLEGGAVWADRLFDYLTGARTGDDTQPWRLAPSPDEERTPRGSRQPLPVPSAP